MFQKVFALGLVASACAAAGPVASNNLRLRGGFAGYGKLTDLPSMHPAPTPLTLDPIPVKHSITRGLMLASRVCDYVRKSFDFSGM